MSLASLRRLRVTDMPATRKMEIVDRLEFVQAVDVATKGDAVAIAMSDLDGFGAINETLGHGAGDLVLAAWIRTLIGSLPKGSIVRRIGGDEFAIALPGHSAEDALIVFHEIRSHLSAHPVDGVGESVLATLGIAARPPHAESTTDLLRCADAALMRGKREGGDRVVIFVEEKMTLKSNYYARGDLDRLSRLATSTARTEASLLREALHDLFDKHRGDA
jgi:diguanylate cyclase